MIMMRLFRRFASLAEGADPKTIESPVLPHDGEEPAAVG